MKTRTVFHIPEEVLFETGISGTPQQSFPCMLSLVINLFLFRLTIHGQVSLIINISGTGVRFHQVELHEDSVRSQTNKW